MSWVLFALGCFGLIATVGDDTGGAPADTAVDLAPEADDSEPGPEPEVVVEDAGAQDPQTLADWVFAADDMHSIAISLSSESYAALQANPYTTVPGAAIIDGLTELTVGVRLRGKWGSFTPIDQKPKFRIDFNAYVPGQRFWGLEALMLNNSIRDASYMREHIAYQMLRDAGVPDSRTGYAHVTLNDQDYGLYVLVEEQDDALLSLWYDDPSGNLYDGKYALYKEGATTLVDFATGVDDLFQLEEGTDVGHADITAVSDAVNATWGTWDFYSTLEPLVDWDEIHREWGVEWFIGQDDGYVLNRNNYRVYFDPADGGRMKMMATDFDYAFIDDSAWGMNWMTPAGKLASGCLLDPNCVLGQLTTMVDLVKIWSARDWAAFIDERAALIHDEVYADPRQPFTPTDYENSLVYLKSWCAARPLQTNELWGPQ